MEKKRRLRAVGFLVLATALLGGTLLAVDARSRALSPPGTNPDAQESVSPTFPIRAAFYYAWYPEAWSQRGITPYTRYRPTAGYYSSADDGIRDAHIRALDYAGFERRHLLLVGSGQQGGRALRGHARPDEGHRLAAQVGALLRTGGQRTGPARR